MKKTLYLLLLFSAIIITFFIYENYSFNNHIENISKSENMNIPINENAPVVSKNKIEIKAPIDIVWKVLTEINNWTKWQKSVTEVEVIGNIEEGTKFNWKAGGLSFSSKIHTSKPMKAFGWTGTTFGASAIHNWKFSEQNGNTVVEVEESLQGVFPKIFKSYFQNNLDKGVLANLMELKSYAETINK